MQIKNFSSGLRFADMSLTKNDFPFKHIHIFSSKPSFDRNQKPSYNRTDSLLAGSLRLVYVPGDTMEVFLKLALANTSKNIETCGVLAGHLSQNQLYITHIITPQQQGTPDSCNTMHEEQIFDVQDQMQLITLGWIHVGFESLVL